MSAHLNFAVIGDPVEHSLSPRLFRALFDELGVDADYGALRTRPEELPERVKSVRDGELTGLSVTLPHKESIIPWVDGLSPHASLIGAVNCVSREGTGKLVGHNTDGHGFQAALEQAGVALPGARVLILGSGGAGRAAAFTAARSGARSLVLANRTPTRAFRLARDLIGSGLARDAADSRSTAPATCPVSVLALTASSVTGQIADLIVNATSVGLDSKNADPLPESFQLAPVHAVLDMVYRPLQTRLLARAREAGSAAIDGLWMLIHQALEQARLWTTRSVSADLAGRLHSELSKEAR